MNNIKIGDRVKIKGENKFGVYIINYLTIYPDYNADKCIYGIKHDKFSEQYHNLNNHCEDGYGYYYELKDLEIINQLLVLNKDGSFGLN